MNNTMTNFCFIVGIECIHHGRKGCKKKKKLKNCKYKSFIDGKIKEHADWLKKKKTRYKVRI